MCNIQHSIHNQIKCVSTNKVSEINVYMYMSSMKNVIITTHIIHAYKIDLELSSVESK